jgi:hypothetical protein
MFENLVVERMKQTVMIEEIEGKATTNDYEGNSVDIDVSMFEKVTIHIFEVGESKAIKYSVDTCLKANRFRNIVTDVVISAGKNDGQTVTDALDKIRIQIKSSVADNHGKFNLYVRGMPA